MPDKHTKKINVMQCSSRRFFLAKSAVSSILDHFTSFSCFKASKCVYLLYSLLGLSSMVFNLSSHEVVIGWYFAIQTSIFTVKFVCKWLTQHTFLHFINFLQIHRSNSSHSSICVVTILDLCCIVLVHHFCRCKFFYSVIEGFDVLLYMSK